MRQAALNADFGGAELPGFHRFLRHLIEGQEVSVRLARAAAEGAEFASHETDVGEIDVAVDDVGDEVADEFGAQQIGGDQQAEQVVAFGVGECVGFFQRQVSAVLRFENFFERRAQRCESGAAQCQTSRAKGKLPVPKSVSSRGMILSVET